MLTELVVVDLEHVVAILASLDYHQERAVDLFSNVYPRGELDRSAVGAFHTFNAQYRATTKLMVGNFL